MANRLSCWLGRHTWVTQVEEGESYEVCSACGKSPRRRKRDIQDPPHDYFGWRSKGHPKVHDDA